MKAYLCNSEVIVLEFGDFPYYGPSARVVFKVHGIKGRSFWVPLDEIMIQ